VGPIRADVEFEIISFVQGDYQTRTVRVMGAWAAAVDVGVGDGTLGHHVLFWICN